VASSDFWRLAKRTFDDLTPDKDAIATMDHATVKEAAGVCKQLFKSKLKQSPDIVQTTSKRFRLRLMADSVVPRLRDEGGCPHHPPCSSICRSIALMIR
jgi:hypothetical protein